MLKPTPDDYVRFKALADVPVAVLQGRFTIIKYLNRLVVRRAPVSVSRGVQRDDDITHTPAPHAQTPLLDYVDLTEGLRAALEPAKHGHGHGAAQVKAKAASSEAPTAATGGAGAGAGAGGSSGHAMTAKERVLAGATQDISLSRIIHNMKGVYFTHTKLSVLNALLALNQRGSGKSQVVMHRLRASRAREDPGSDPSGMRSLFGQLFKSLRKVKPTVWRQAKPNEQLWNVDFLGEGSIDVGGPYRESITLACQDLMSSATPLFIPSPNASNDVGLNREKWIINPAASTPLALDMFEFVGAMFGIALRTKFTLPLDLPSIVWRQVLGETPDEGDLEAIDKLCIQALSGLKKLSAEEFLGMQAEFYTTQLSDGSVVELKEGGEKVQNRDFCVLVCLVCVTLPSFVCLCGHNRFQ